MHAARKPIAVGSAIALILSILLPMSAGALSVKEEEELSREVLKVVFKNYKIVDDTYISDYVNAVGKRILSQMPEQPFRYRFYVILDASYNAFATPAGHVFVNSGLFEAMESEEELAGILGHEISHVYCRHISEKIERSKKVGLASLAGIAAGVLLGAGGVGPAASAVTMGSAAAGISVELAYSRDNEMQADQLGLQLLTAAGYNPSGLLNVLRKIRSKRWFGSEQIPTYLSTHPAVEDRLAYIDSWLATRSAAGELPAPVDSSAFNRIHTRLHIGYGDVKQVHDELAAALRNAPQDPEANYRYGLILARMDRRRDAIDHLKKALARRAFDPYILRDLGRVYFLDGQFAQAAKILDGARSVIADDPDTLFFTGRTQLELNDPTTAASTFNRLIEREPLYREAYYFLGKSLSEQGLSGEAAYQLGVYYRLSRDYRNAVMQLKQALNLTQDPARREQIQALLKDSQEQLGEAGQASGG